MNRRICACALGLAAALLRYADSPVHAVELDPAVVTVRTPDQLQVARSGQQGAEQRHLAARRRQDRPLRQHHQVEQGQQFQPPAFPRQRPPDLHPQRHLVERHRHRLRSAQHDPDPGGIVRDPSRQGRALGRREGRGRGAADHRRRSRGEHARQGNRRHLQRAQSRPRSPISRRTSSSGAIPPTRRPPTR